MALVDFLCEVQKKLSTINNPDVNSLGSDFSEIFGDDHFGKIVKVAVVQAGSIIYDTPQTLKKLESLVEEAARAGAQIALFPETFIGGYPKGIDFGIHTGFPTLEGREELKRYFDNAIAYNGPEAEKMAEIAATHKMHLVVGVVEKAGTTLFSSVFFYGPDGTHLGKHRKLMPTAFERIVWGCGDGTTLPVLNTSVGRVGAVICWENYMPMLRTCMYNKGIQIYFAPTIDDRESWLATMRTIALEGRCFVVSACQYLTSGAYPANHSVRSDGQETDVVIAGGSCVVNPFGEVVLQPSYDGERVAVVELDLSEIVAAKFDLDAVGHYARPDIFQLFVNEKGQTNVRTEK